MNTVSLTSTPASSQQRIGLDVVLLLLALLTYPLDAIVSSWLVGTDAREGEGITPAQVLTYLLVAVCAWKALWSKDTRPLRIAFGGPVPILIMCYLATLLLSASMARTLGEGKGQIAQRISLFLFYIVMITTIRNRRILWLAVLAFVVSSGFVCVAGAYEIVTQDAVLPEWQISDTIIKEGLRSESTGRFRIQGLSHNPDGLPGDMLAQLGLLFYLLVRSPNWKWKALTGLLALLAVANLAASGSRAALLGLVFAIVVFILAAPFRHKFAILVVAGGTVAVTCAALILAVPDLAFVDKIMDTTGAGSQGTEFRVQMVQVSWEMGRRKPVVGVGPGNFRSEQRRHQFLTTGLSREKVYASHNIYMSVFAETGFLGLATYCLMHLAIVLQIVRCIRQAPDRDMKLMGAGLLASFMAFVCALNFYPSGGNKYGWTVIALAGAMAALLAAEREAAAEKPVPSRGFEHPPYVSSDKT